MVCEKFPSKTEILLIKKNQSVCTRTPAPIQETSEFRVLVAFLQTIKPDPKFRTIPKFTPFKPQTHGLTPQLPQTHIIHNSELENGSTSRRSSTENPVTPQTRHSIVKTRQTIRSRVFGTWKAEAGQDHHGLFETVSKLYITNLETNNK